MRKREGKIEAEHSPKEEDARCRLAGWLAGRPARRWHPHPHPHEPPHPHPMFRLKIRFQPQSQRARRTSEEWTQNRASPTNSECESRSPLWPNRDGRAHSDCTRITALVVGRCRRGDGAVLRSSRPGLGTMSAGGPEGRGGEGTRNEGGPDRRTRLLARSSEPANPSRQDSRSAADAERRQSARSLLPRDLLSNTRITSVVGKPRWMDATCPASFRAPQWRGVTFHSSPPAAPLPGQNH